MLCVGCKDEVHSKGKYQFHSCLPIGQSNREILTKCSKHEKEEDLFCLTDNQILCIYCFQFDGHKDHSCLLLKEAARRFEESSQSLVEEVIQKQVRLKRTAEEFLEEIEKNDSVCQQVELLIKADFDKIIEGLRRRQDELLDLVLKVKATREGELKLTRQTILNEVTKLTELQLKLMEPKDKYQKDPREVVLSNSELNAILKNDSEGMSHKASQFEIIVQLPSETVDPIAIGSIKLGKS
eukprot:TRINITY_DN1205_c0_g1_i1.p1 TRINITY_DN1205_c0_g1~~TRINITY_DN1205_c0_g1_i1.p1  ORF type:complete len:239 (-),score=44.89 TRINITY_DN1205_c0_g1_i1:49-765(-)